MVGLAWVCLLWVIPLALADIFRSDVYLSLEWMDRNPGWTPSGTSGYRAFLLWYGKTNIGMEKAFQPCFNSDDEVSVQSMGLTSRMQ